MSEKEILSLLLNKENLSELKLYDLLKQRTTEIEAVLPKILSQLPPEVLIVLKELDLSKKILKSVKKQIFKLKQKGVIKDERSFSRELKKKAPKVKATVMSSPIIENASSLDKNLGIEIGYTFYLFSFDFSEDRPLLWVEPQTKEQGVKKINVLNKLINERLNDISINNEIFDDFQKFMKLKFDLDYGVFILKKVQEMSYDESYLVANGDISSFFVEENIDLDTWYDPNFFESRMSHLFDEARKDPSYSLLPDRDFHSFLFTYDEEMKLKKIVKEVKKLSITLSESQKRLHILRKLEDFKEKVFTMPRRRAISFFFKDWAYFYYLIGKKDIALYYIKIALDIENEKKPWKYVKFLRDYRERYLINYYEKLDVDSDFDEVDEFEFIETLRKSFAPLNDSLKEK